MTGPEAIVQGLCWLACKPSRLRQLRWAGVAKFWNQVVPLYSCEPCLRLYAERAVAGTGAELCWLWCGRSGGHTELIGDFELAVWSWRTEPGRPPELVVVWSCTVTVYGCPMCTDALQSLIHDQAPAVQPPPGPPLGPHLTPVPQSLARVLPLSPAA